MSAPTHRLARYPTWLTHWLGYRATPHHKVPEPFVWIWSWFGAFAGLAVLQGLFGHSKYFIDRKVPPLVASYGASCVLVFGAIEAPLAQPRAFVGGHFISGLIGLCITKLFSLSPHFESLRWLAASISTATAIVAMQITGTTHPPAGSTALLPAIDDTVWAMSWYYLPVILLSCAIFLFIACIVNNIQRRYPMYWFKPAVSIPAKPEPALGAPDDDATSEASTCAPTIVAGIPTEKRGADAV
ncbi:uncharacterized protein FIBRA_08919 [Fibroporia radiculosa]|uniref:HPP transmembrane region domain-containing protein n=1 Tax=Fibroporia radiculosa TaxID=599839 RepID=J4GII4_9APHY|nr:uncharacterized protein FIBRA_08919 [Fibroporia radiculosa]CCM06638.1 predicted protein [Fibroporia radiculosa]